MRRRADYDAEAAEEVLNAEAESLVIAAAAFGRPAHSRLNRTIIRSPSLGPAIRAARRDESHRLLASQPCRSRLQAENYLALISGPIPVIRTASASIPVIVDLPFLGDGPGDSRPSPGQVAGSSKISGRLSGISPGL